MLAIIMLLSLLMIILQTSYEYMNVLGDEASGYFVNMSPFEMKHLLHQILSGREFEVTEGKQS